MNEFLLIFRRDFTSKEDQPSPDQLQHALKDWQDWFGEIAGLDRLARPLQRWDAQGKIVKADKMVTDGPYAEIKESIGGMIFIWAEDYEEAAEIAKGCPILSMRGSVEIRKAATPDPLE